MNFEVLAEENKHSSIVHYFRHNASLDNPWLRSVPIIDWPRLRGEEVEGFHFVKATDDPIMGAAEEILPYVAPAVCNAIFAATGKRIRKLPVKNTNLAWA